MSDNVVLIYFIDVLAFGGVDVVVIVGVLFFYLFLFVVLSIVLLFKVSLSFAY